MAVACLTPSAKRSGYVFGCSGKGIAVLEISDIALDKNSSIGKHPSDYKLMLLGEFDNVSGVFEGKAIPELVCTAVEFVNNI